MSRKETWRVLALVAAVATGATPAAAQQYKHGALAIDQRNGDQWGWAVDYEYQAEADARALRECSQGSDNCHIVLRFSQGCGAYVVERGNPSLYGWAIADTRAAAESRARHEASIRGGRDLVLRVWGCNTRQPDRPDQTEADRLAAELAAARALREQQAAMDAASERERLRAALDSARAARAQAARDSVQNGRLAGRVTHALTRAGIAGAAVVIQGDAGTYHVGTSGDGSYTSPLIPDGLYAVTAQAEGYQTASLYGARVTRTRTTTAASIPLVPASDQPGTISGAVRNARNAQPMGNVRVSLRAGIGSTSGAPVATTTTTTSGAYRFSDLGAGTYSVTASFPEYVDGLITGISVGGSEVSNQDVMLSPEGTENEIRIVLSWGTEPRDLDSHLYGPSGGGRFHIAYNSRGSLTAAPQVALDVDDTSSHGPETVTIVAQQPGVYRYAVHHYAGGGTISTSGAVVQVYRGGTLLARFEPPAGSSGSKDVWHVFELDGSSIREVNVISRSFPN